MCAYVSIGMDFRFLGNNIKVSTMMYRMALLVFFDFVKFIFYFNSFLLRPILVDHKRVFLFISYVEKSHRHLSC